ncbi:RNA binding protein [Histoplasma capsulatum]|uniref:RNA binding protein n=1 Tax=Ajellomyces capsulatus TaxID=5037 RepID=A0A8A1MJC4_AJECA|nr:RNA binding protein [Histoplasma capsulatum]
MPPKSESEPISSSGITVNALTGERHIPASTRADGSQRREIKIRPGYQPPEDIQVYKNRTAEAWKNRGKGGIPGVEGLGEESARTTAATAASNKNAKKREAKRRAKAAEGENGLSTTSGKVEGGVPGKAKEKENWRESKKEENPGADADVVHDAEVEKEKKLRNLRKKLRQARELRERKDNGENLLPEQFEKVIKIQELVRQLDALGFDSEGERKKTSAECADHNP